jgi:hypothetical protein
MPARRTALVASLVLVALAPSAHAAGTKPLDGKRRTHVRFSAHLDDPAFDVNSDRTRNDPLMPTRQDCSSPNSCDVTDLRLTLPPDTSGGVFTASLKVERTLNVYVVLYDSRGGVTKSLQPVDPEHDDDCCDDYVRAPGSDLDTDYVVDFTIGRLRAGKYTLVVYDRGGTGAVTTDISFTALHPDRQTPPKKK